MSTSQSEQKPNKSEFKALWDFIFLSGGESLGKLAGFLAFAYLARTLDTALYGAVELAIAILAIFGLIVDFGFTPIGAREVAQRPGKAARWAALIIGTRLLFAVVCVPLMWIVAALLDLPERETQLIWVVSLALFAIVGNQVWLLQGLEKMRLVSLNQALRMFLFALGVFLFVKSDNDLLYVGVIEVVAALGMAAFLLYLQRREGIPLAVTFRLRHVAWLIRRASSIGFGQAVWALNQYISIIMVAYLAGAVAGAWFAAAHRVVTALTSYSLVYHFNLFPATSTRLKQSISAYLELAQASTRVVAWCGTGAALAGSLLAEPICVFIFGSDFRSAGVLLAVLFWSLPLTIMSGHCRFALIASENQYFVLVAQTGGAITTILLGLFLIPTYGPVGASISMVASHAVVWTIVHRAISRRVCRIPALEVVAMPATTALLSFALAWYSDFSIAGALGGILLFFILAPVLDRRFIPSFKRLARIKSQAAA